MSCLLDDPDIYKIALSAQKIEALLPGERPLRPDTVMVGTYWYIGKKGDTLFLFENNLHEYKAERIKMIGKLDEIYRCEAIERDLQVFF